ncbi:hypothetical protein RFI_21239, partial [Reticulomyxa filosa]
KKKKKKKKKKKEKENERNAQQIEGLKNKSAKLQNTMISSEREEAFRILRKMEKDHESKLQKLKIKHNEELEVSAEYLRICHIYQVTNGILQTLGAEAGQDIFKVIRQLKDKNNLLQQQVDVLAETYPKQLFKALHAVDDISITTTAMDDEKLIQDVIVDSVRVGRPSIISKLKNRKKNGNTNANIQTTTTTAPNKNNKNNNASANTSSVDRAHDKVLPPPPTRNSIKATPTSPLLNQTSSSGGLVNNRGAPPSSSSDLNASFFKNASTSNPSPQTKEKPTDAFSKSLATDVAKKQDVKIFYLTYTHKK